MTLAQRIALMSAADWRDVALILCLCVIAWAVSGGKSGPCRWRW